MRQLIDSVGPLPPTAAKNRHISRVVLPGSYLSRGGWRLESLYISAVDRGLSNGRTTTKLNWGRSCLVRTGFREWLRQACPDASLARTRLARRLRRPRSYVPKREFGERSVDVVGLKRICQGTRFFYWLDAKPWCRAACGNVAHNAFVTTLGSAILTPFQNSGRQLCVSPKRLFDETPQPAVGPCGKTSNQDTTSHWMMNPSFVAEKRSALVRNSGLGAATKRSPS
jgi:hypothetical protein